MGTLTGNVWVCAECRSINNERAKQCYNCRTPRDLAAVDPSTIQGTGHGKLRDVALPPFESPRPYAVIASIAILATAGLQVVYTVNLTALILQTLDKEPAALNQLAFMGTIGLATLAIGIVALVTWSLWLSSAVASMPALGLGYPAATRLTAFVENFLPGLNLLRVPAIVRDVVRRLESGSTAGQARGEALIFAAWIGLLGGFVVPRVFGFINGFTADSEDGVLRTQLTIQGIAIGLVLVGALFLVALIWWIEERIARRREAQLASIDAVTAGGVAEPAEPAEEGVAIPESIERIPAAPPATVRWSWGESSDSPIAASARPSPPTIAGSAAGWDTELLPPFVPQAATPTSVQTPAAAPSQAQAPEPVPVSAPPPVTERQPEVAAQAVPEELPQAEMVVPHAPQPEVVNAEPVAAPEPVAAMQPEPAPASAARANGAPHLTIRIENHGMLRAEMGDETELVILDDLTAYGQALAHAGGTAEIVIVGSDGMAPLIARRAQRILAESGIEAPLPE